MTSLPISLIRTDGGTQPRAGIDFTAVDDYSDAMRDGTKFPPVTVFYDGSAYWLADGFHRVKAAFAADLEEIACDVHQGTQEDAQWYSFSANKSNGLRRTNEDKQRAVKAALAHPKSASLSDHQIAKHVGVDVKTVGNWREKKPASMEIPQMRTVTRNGTTYQQNTANIGRKPEPFDGGTRVALERSASLAQPEERLAPASFNRPIPTKPEPRLDNQVIARQLLAAIFELADHGISAADLVSCIPDSQISLSYQKARAAFEFVGFVFENAAKRQRSIA